MKKSFVAIALFLTSTSAFAYPDSGCAGGEELYQGRMMQRCVPAKMCDADGFDLAFRYSMSQFGDITQDIQGFCASKLLRKLSPETMSIQKIAGDRKKAAAQAAEYFEGLAQQFRKIQAGE